MLNLQNILISSTSIALIPLLAFPLSFLQSWHCIFMCGALQTNRTRLSQNLFLQGRLLGYAAAGATYGYFGQRLSQTLEYQAIGALAYFFFAILTLGLLIYWLFNLFSIKKTNHNNCHSSYINKKRPSFFHGLLMAFVPCPLLFQFFTLATLTGSMLGGLLVGLAHGLASTPALWWGPKILNKTVRFKYARQIIQITMGLLLIFNLFYFSGRFLNPNEDITTKLLFCF